MMKLGCSHKVLWLRGLAAEELHKPRTLGFSSRALPQALRTHRPQSLNPKAEIPKT